MNSLNKSYFINFQVFSNFRQAKFMNNFLFHNSTVFRFKLFHKEFLVKHNTVLLLDFLTFTVI